MAVRGSTCVVDGLMTVLVFIVALPLETIVNQNFHMQYNASTALILNHFLGSVTLFYTLSHFITLFHSKAPWSSLCPLRIDCANGGPMI